MHAPCVSTPVSRRCLAASRVTDPTRRKTWFAAGGAFPEFAPPSDVLCRVRGTTVSAPSDRKLASRAPLDAWFAYTSKARDAERTPCKGSSLARPRTPSVVSWLFPLLGCSLLRALTRKCESHLVCEEFVGPTAHRFARSPQSLASCEIDGNSELARAHQLALRLPVLRDARCVRPTSANHHFNDAHPRLGGSGLRCFRFALPSRLSSPGFPGFCQHTRLAHGLERALRNETRERALHGVRSASAGGLGFPRGVFFPLAPRLPCL